MRRKRLSKGFQKQFEQAGLGITVKLRFFYPEVPFRQFGPILRLPEIEIGHNQPMRKLMLDSGFEEMPGQAGHDGFFASSVTPDPIGGLISQRLI
jgi:hypothetical protein